MNVQPERAWQMVLGQLRLQMSVANFNTWVNNTEFISYEDGVLTIGAANTFASEWLASTVTRWLAGILNQAVTLQFVVHEPSYSEEDHVEEIEEASLEKGKPLELG
jgi:chromosomal replication initiation ATPase DnaA